MSDPFLIRHPETHAEYELNDPAYFVSHYKPKGFEIVDPPPTGYTVPELPEQVAIVFDADTGAPELDFGKMSRDELNAYAVSVGVEAPDASPNKGAVIDAIQDLTASDAEAAD